MRKQKIKAILIAGIVTTNIIATNVVSAAVTELTSVESTTSTDDELTEGEESSEEDSSSIKYSGGDGTEESPYQISTANDLELLANEVNAGDGQGYLYFELTSDIDLSGYTSWTPIGDRENPFQGIFNGNGYTISNLTIDSNEEYQGLFGCIDLDGKIKNVNLTDVNVTGYNYVGALVGYAVSSVEILNCTVSGNVTGNYYVGGITGAIGYAFDFDSCSVSGTIKGNSYVGGIAGLMKKMSTLTNSNTTCDVIGESDSVGGIAGSIQEAFTIENCYSTGDIQGDNRVGGIAGHLLATTVKNSYATGSVSGNDAIGGIAGYFNAGIENCYNTSTVTGSSYVGGLAGYGYSIYSVVANSYSAGAVNGTTDVGSLFGYLNMVNFGEGSQLYSCYSDITVNSTLELVGEIQNSTLADINGSNFLTEDMIGENSVKNLEGFDFEYTWNVNSDYYPTLKSNNQTDYTPIINGDGSEDTDGTEKPEVPETPDVPETPENPDNTENPDDTNDKEDSDDTTGNEDDEESGDVDGDESTDEDEDTSGDLEEDGSTDNTEVKKVESISELIATPEYIGSNVKIAGTITKIVNLSVAKSRASEYVQAITIKDADAEITIYSTSYVNLAVGDSIEVTGVLMGDTDELYLSVSKAADLEVVEDEASETPKDEEVVEDETTETPADNQDKTDETVDDTKEDDEDEVENDDTQSGTDNVVSDGVKTGDVAGVAAFGFTGLASLISSAFALKKRK